MARRGKRPGTCAQQIDTLLRGSAPRQQVQRRREPARGAFRCEPCRQFARLAQDGDGSKVALSRRALDMVGARRA
jgi:hypothetical protein